MKGDDDTFVRVDAIINEAKKVPENKSLYIGNINYYHKPQRSGKWAVTYEVVLKSLRSISHVICRILFSSWSLHNLSYLVSFNFKPSKLAVSLFWNMGQRELVCMVMQVMCILK